MTIHFIYPEGAEEFGIQRALSQKERDAIPNNLFAWPDAPDGPEYPIDTQAHLDAAATLIGRAPESEQGKIKANAIRIAKKKGLTLPKSWQDEQKSDDKQERTLTVPDNLQMYMPITRADEKEWIVEGQATSEAVDSYGTIFEYESSKRAFQEWIKRGNIREQHDFHKAVGKALGVEFDDANKIIYVRARISKGARDTWEKILDGTLSGYSISVPGDAKVRYVERGNHRVPMYHDFRLAELSVVDAPGSPNCDIRPLVRADGVVTDLIDDIPEADTSTTTPESQEPAPTQPLERAGARMSADTQGKMHQSIAHTLHAASSMMQNCGCDDCCAALKLIDPDGDGDIDMGGYDDPDHDWQALYADDNAGTAQDTERMVTGVIERVLEQKFSYVLARFQSIAGTLARVNGGNAHTSPDFESLISGAITRAVDAAKTANASSFAEVRASLGAVKEQVDAIANTPMPGSPVMNANSVNRPVDKRLATDPYDMPRRSGSAVYDAVAALSSTGHLDTVDKQVDAVAAALAAQRRG